MRRPQTGRGSWRSQTLASLVTLAWLALLCLLAGSCAKESAEDRCACDSPDAGAPVDPALLAFLSRARSAHHRADVLEEQGKLGPAIAQLGKVTEGPRPRGQQPHPHPEVQEVLADTRARVADLKSRLGKFDEAMQEVKVGLGLARQLSYFRGHLFEVRGLVEERRAKTLKEQGDAPAAEAAKQRALSAFEQAMEIQAEVIRQAVPKE